MEEGGGAYVNTSYITQQQKQQQQQPQLTDSFLNMSKYSHHAGVLQRDREGRRDGRGGRGCTVGSPQPKSPSQTVSSARVTS